MNTAIQNIRPGQLVRGETLLELLFPVESERPTLAWLTQQRKRKAVPFIRIGRLIYFDPDQVRKAIY